MDNLTLEKIEFLFELIKWVLYLFGAFLVFAARIAWLIFKSISDLKNNHIISEIQFKHLEEKHEALSLYVYQKN